jgi:hypothetical protein
MESRGMGMIKARVKFWVDLQIGLKF